MKENPPRLHAYYKAKEKRSTIHKEVGYEQKLERVERQRVNTKGSIWEALGLYDMCSGLQNCEVKCLIDSL